MADARVGFITVNYRNAADTRAMAESLAQLRRFSDCCVTILDNASTDDSAAALEPAVAAIASRTRLLHVRENLYYFGGAAHALAATYPHPDAMPDWIVVCNNDVVIRDPAFVERLLAHDPARYGVIAPSIIADTTGRDQNPFLRRPRGRLELLKWELYYASYALALGLLAVDRLRAAALGPLSRLRGRARGPARPAGEERIYAPHGAFIVFSRAYFQKGGKLDTTAALYAEEITVAEIARRIGVNVFYCPELQVFHRAHATTGSRLTRAKYGFERQAYRHFRSTYP